MRVSMHDGRRPDAVDRILEPARAEERVDLLRLAHDGPRDRGVMEHDDLLLRAETRERALELHRLVDGLLHERLDRALAPGTQRAGAEAASEAFRPGEPDAADLRCVAVEDAHAGLAQDVADRAR